MAESSSKIAKISVQPKLIHASEASKKFCAAADRGTIKEMEQLWREHSNEIDLSHKHYDAIYWIVHNNDQNKLDFIMYTCKISKKAVEVNAMNGWGIFNQACSNGNLKMVKQIYEYFNIKNNKELQRLGETGMRYAIHSNIESTLNVMDWLSKTFRIGDWIYDMNFYRTEGAKMQLVFSERIKVQSTMKKFASHHLSKLCGNIEMLNQIKPYVDDIHNMVVYEAYVKWLNDPEVVDWFEEVFHLNTRIIANEKVRDHVLSIIIGHTIFIKQNNGIINLLQMLIASNTITEKQLFELYITACGSCNEELVEYILTYIPRQTLNKYEHNQLSVTQYNFLNAACRFKHSDKDSIVFNRMASQIEKYTGNITTENIEKYLTFAIRMNLLHVVEYLIKNLKNILNKGKHKQRAESIAYEAVNTSIQEGKIEILDYLLTDFPLQTDYNTITHYIHKAIKSTNVRNTFDYLVQKFNVTILNKELIKVMKTRALVMEAMVRCKYETAMYLINELEMELIPAEECQIYLYKHVTSKFSRERSEIINDCLLAIISSSNEEWIQKIFAMIPNYVLQNVDVKKLIKGAAKNHSYAALDWLHKNYKEDIDKELGANAIKILENQLRLNPSDEMKRKIAHKKHLMISLYTTMATQSDRLSVYNAKNFYDQYNIQITEEDISYILSSIMCSSNNKEILEHVYEVLPESSRELLLKRIKSNIETNKNEYIHTRLYEWAKQQLIPAYEMQSISV